MKITKIAALILIVSLNLTGCTTDKNKNDSKNKLYATEMYTTINIEEYSEVIGEILTYREFDEAGKQMIRDKYLNVVKANVFSQLEDLQNSTKLVYPGDDPNILEEDTDGEYPIYDENYTIIDYGTSEEHKESVRGFYSRDLNIIENIESTNNTIIVKINNRYNGIFYVYATLQGNMINYINILR